MKQGEKRTQKKCPPKYYAVDAKYYAVDAFFPIYG